MSGRNSIRSLSFLSKTRLTGAILKHVTGLSPSHSLESVSLMWPRPVPNVLFLMINGKIQKEDATITNESVSNHRVQTLQSQAGHFKAWIKQFHNPKKRF